MTQAFSNAPATGASITKEHVSMNTQFSNARKCLRCGWEWMLRPSKAQYSGEPKQCPRCRTEKWNTPKEGAA